MTPCYLHYRTDFPLASCVESLWLCEGYTATHQRERVLPNGRLQMVIDLGTPAASSVIVGMRTRHEILETSRIQSVMGVVFRPGGTLPFLGVPAGEFQDLVIALDDVWKGGALSQRLLETPAPADRLRILEAELTRRFAESRPLHPSVRHALAHFARTPETARILEVARESGLSRRRFSGLFHEQVGLPPKQFCRLLRFQRVVGRIAGGEAIDWAQVSLDGGYYDQAHMAHEFREFSGVSPGAWRSSERPFLNHAVVD